MRTRADERRYAAGRFAPTGVVDHLGAKAIRGWIHVDPGLGVQKVGLYIHGVEATTVTAMPASGARTGNRQIRTFNFTLYDFWKYTERSSHITVRVNGHPLPIAGHGMYYPPLNNGGRPLAELREKLAEGWIFTSDGKFRLNKNSDRAWQDNVLALYRGVYDEVHSTTGYEPFFVYGSLLGAVREKGFIGHDFDVDCAYVSMKPTGEEAAAEVLALGYQLLEAGYHVEARVVCLHVYEPKQPDTRIDLFHLYFDPETTDLRFAWGVAGEKRFTRDLWQGVEEVPFADTTTRIPRNAEALVETIYGPTWRTPNAGFTWDGNRRHRAMETRIDADACEALNWESYYAHGERRGPSAFAERLLATGSDPALEFALPTRVLDLGCGDGRDAVAFAAAGHTVHGLDLSPRAVGAAEQRNAELPEQERPTYARCDLGRSDELRTVFTARAGTEAILFYGRFLLHALTEDTAQVLLDAIFEHATEGDVVAFEFRTTDDAKLHKARWLPIRRYLDADELGAELAAHGFTELLAERGTGLAKQDTEDPFVARVVARRGPSTG